MLNISITSSSPTTNSNFKLDEILVPLMEKKLCSQNLECSNDDCKLFHAKIKKNKFIIERHPMKFKIFICSFFQKDGYCKHGINCKDLHIETDFKSKLLKVYESQANLAPILATSAGILPYSINDENGEVYFLLGKEKKNKYVWCDFGGKYSPEDKSYLFTAAREACEETMGLLGRTDEDLTEDLISKENLMISINYIEGLLLRKKGVYHHLIGNHYHQYICHIPWINDELLNEALVLNRKKDYKLRHVEKQQYKWVRGSELLKIIDELNDIELLDKKKKIGIKNGENIEEMRKSFISSLKKIQSSIKELVNKFSPN